MHRGFFASLAWPLLAYAYRLMICFINQSESPLLRFIEDFSIVVKIEGWEVDLYFNHHTTLLRREKTRNAFKYLLDSKCYVLTSFT